MSPEAEASTNGALLKLQHSHKMPCMAVSNRLGESSYSQAITSRRAHARRPEMGARKREHDDG